MKSAVYIFSINARVLTEREGGPARYLRNIIYHLTQLDKKNIWYLLVNREYHFPFDLPDNFKPVVLNSNSKLWYEYVRLPLWSWRKKPQVSLFPKNTFSPFFYGYKFPVFHDIIYFEKEQKREFSFFDNLHHRIMIPVAARFAKKNIAISDFTASRMNTLLSIDYTSTAIIKNGVEDRFRKISDNQFLQSVVEKYNLQKPFLFYAGSLSPRKNMVRVVRAFASLKDRIPHHLYFTGGHSWRDSAVFQEITAAGLETRVRALGFLDEEELVALYNLADACVYPSLYEGFGLPILEAQACGCPVVTSTVASCPEVAGDGAELVDPYEIDSIAKGIVKIVDNREYREKMIDNGYKNLSRFSWKKAASELLSLFQSNMRKES